MPAVHPNECASVLSPPTGPSGEAPSHDGRIGRRVRRAEAFLEDHWLRRSFGWSVARQAQIRLPQLKTVSRMAWDKAMFAVEARLTSERDTSGAGGDAHSSRRPVA